MWTKTTTRPNSHTAKDKPTGSPHTAPPNKPNEHDPKGRARLALCHIPKMATYILRSI